MLKLNEFEAIVKSNLEEIRDLILDGKNKEALDGVAIYRNCIEFLDKTREISSLLELTAKENLEQEIMEAKIRAEIEAELKAKAEMEAKTKSEAETKARLEAEMAAKAAKEAEMKALAEAKLEAEMKAEAEKKAKLEAEAKSKAKTEARIRAKIEAEMKAEAKSNAMPKLETPDLDFSKTPNGMREMTEKEMLETEPAAMKKALEKLEEDETPAKAGKDGLAKKLNGIFDKYLK